MLGKTVIEKEKNERDIFDMAGSGFESTVRLAKSSPAMWTPIFRQNKENVLEILRAYIENLEAFRDKLYKDDFEGIYSEMDNTNKIREILKGIPLNRKVEK
jgi:prephenate dehydrogenase